MAGSYLDTKADFTQWSALQPDGVTPSIALSAAAETSPPLLRYGPDGKSVRITAGTDSLQHRLRWTLPATNLSAYDELRFYMRSSRAADGSPALPFFLELRLGSAALAIDAQGNTWVRLLPVAQPAAWEFQRFALADLPAAVRNAVTTVELRVADTSVPFAVHLDDLLAVREEMVVDVEAALVARLDKRLTLNNAQVPALVSGPGVTVPQAPYFQIALHDLKPAELQPPRGRRDHVPGGYSMPAQWQAWELTYRIDTFGSDRPTEARMLEFLLRSLGQRGELIVVGGPVPLEWVQVPVAERGGTRVPLFYKVLCRQEAEAPARVKAVSQVLVNTDFRQSA